MRKHIKQIILVAVLLICAVGTLKIVDFSISKALPKSTAEELAIVDSSRYEVDSVLFNEIDEKIAGILIEKDNSMSKPQALSLAKRVNISPAIQSHGNLMPMQSSGSSFNYGSSSKSKVDTTYYRSNKQLKFYLVSAAGYINDRNGQMQYFLPAYEQRYYYELILREGLYTFVSLSPKDTLTFFVGNGGVYKLGFQEAHPNFTILRDSLP